MFLVIFNQDIYLFVAITILFPAYILFKLNTKTKILDFLLFSIFFLCGTMTGSLNVLEGLTNNLLFNQLFEIFWDFWYIVLLLHALRMKNENINRKIFAIALSYFVLLFIIILLWKNFPQPNSATVIFITLIHNYSSFYPAGAGFELSNNVIIYSSAFRMLGDYYRVIITGYIILTYIRVEPIVQTNLILKAKRLWLLAWIIFLMWNILIMLPLPPSIPTGLPFFIVSLLILYITWKYPESMVLTHAQFARAIKLYDLMITQEKIHDIQLEPL